MGATHRDTKTSTTHVDADVDHFRTRVRLPAPPPFSLTQRIHWGCAAFLIGDRRRSSTALQSSGYVDFVHSARTMAVDGATPSAGAEGEVSAMGMRSAATNDAGRRAAL